MKFCNNMQFILNAVYLYKNFFVFDFVSAETSSNIFIIAKEITGKNVVKT